MSTLTRTPSRHVLTPGSKFDIQDHVARVIQAQDALRTSIAQSPETHRSATRFDVDCCSEGTLTSPCLVQPRAARRHLSSASRIPRWSMTYSRPHASRSAMPPAHGQVAVREPHHPTRAPRRGRLAHVAGDHPTYRVGMTRKEARPSSSPHFGGIVLIVVVSIVAQEAHRHSRPPPRWRVWRVHVWEGSELVPPQPSSRLSGAGGQRPPGVACRECGTGVG